MWGFFVAPMPATATKKRRKAAAKCEQLYEEEFSSSLKLDADAGVIRHVKILGRVSKNGGREYSDKALKQAAGLYEGVAVNIDHNRGNPNAERGIGERFGVLKKAVVESDGVYGELHYLKQHSLAPQITEMADRMPESFGLSHNADGRVRRSKGRAVVESLEKVRSVDVVGVPATTKGLFESEDYPMSKTIQQILDDAPAGTKGRAHLAALLEQEVTVGEVPVAELPVAEPTGDPDEDIKKAFHDAAKAAIDNDDLDAMATVAKVKEILVAEEKIVKKKDPAAEPPAEPPADTPVAESVEVKRLLGKVERLEQKDADHETRDTCRALLESAGRDVTDERLEILSEVSKSNRKALVESWAQPKSGRPGSSPGIRLHESEGECKDYDEFKRKFGRKATG